MKGKTKAQRVAVFLKKAGKTRYTAVQVAEKCGCCAEYVMGFASWKKYQKQFDTPRQERVKNFLDTVWDEPQKHTAGQVAKHCDCTIIYVYRQDTWKAYQKHRKRVPTEKCISRFLAKNKTGRKIYTAGIANHVCFFCYLVFSRADLERF